MISSEQDTMRQEIQQTYDPRCGLRRNDHGRVSAVSLQELLRCTLTSPPQISAGIDTQQRHPRRQELQRPDGQTRPSHERTNCRAAATYHVKIHIFALYRTATPSPCLSERSVRYGRGLWMTRGTRQEANEDGRDGRGDDVDPEQGEIAGVEGRRGIHGARCGGLWGLRA